MKKYDADPRVVAIGGGNGLSTMLRGLKTKTDRLTAVVTVADDGGGSGVLRQEMGMPPPGDIRNCMEALANTEPMMQRLLSYRFTEGSLSGQAFGNLLLAALNGISDSFDQAVTKMSQVLAITGRIMPVTNADVQLEARFENGARVLGESKIAAFKKAQDCRIDHVSLLPEHPPALPEVIEAIREADIIVLGPGSLYTSVIPNLLVEDVADAICESSALKIYVCNIMTQDGETEGYTASDHITALLEHAAPGLVNVCLCNSAAVSQELMARYRAEDAAPIEIDRCAVERMGVELVSRPLTSEDSAFARHSSEKLADAIFEIYHEKAHTRIL